ncbi:MAG TPA: hypothetical protein VLC72_01455 [Nitrosopumilaceae archaeon]|nr:hypothetical protein [Nitrosopumilaceae archaeon]
MVRKQLSMNTKIIIVLSIAAILIVFSTNILPDLIEDESETVSNEYRYETTFSIGRPSESNQNKEKISP